jgi:hypothetical protein
MRAAAAATGLQKTLRDYDEQCVSTDRITKEKWINP